jgi:hypothetical protein
MPNQRSNPDSAQTGQHRPRRSPHQPKEAIDVQANVRARPLRPLHSGQHRPRHQDLELKKRPMFKSTIKLVRYALSTLASTGLGISVN